MGKSYRIKANPGKDKNIVVNLEQDFEQLDILSLKIRQDEIYIRMCSDYGVIAGRVFSNNGYGIPNAKVSVFIPVTQDDLDNPNISSIYPYETPQDVNDDGYKYNLLPYSPSYTGHVPTGTFPTRRDVLVNNTASKIYEKYYKYTVKTNESGDYLIFGVPIGEQTLILNVDLSDIGEFSMLPQDLVRMGLATESQLDGANFKSSSNIDTLPQIIQLSKSVDVVPFWGENDICQIGISRMDFDLTSEANVTIQPTAIFMGSIFSTPDEYGVKVNGKVKRDSGNLCKLITGPGEVIGITQSVFLDEKGLPVLRIADLPNGGKLIDENGVWLFDVPMNNNFVTTNEFGEQILSDDPRVGVPTTGKYRFKIKWQQNKTLTDPYKRGYFLVPNIRENGWFESDDDPFLKSTSSQQYKKAVTSYAFDLNWSAYTSSFVSVNNDELISYINCEDRFYNFEYNKVYTVSGLIDNFKTSNENNRFLSIKRIDDDSCENVVNKFPTNDGVFYRTLFYTVTRFLVNALLSILVIVVPIYSVVATIVNIIYDLILNILCGLCNSALFKNANFCDKIVCTPERKPLLGSLKLPMITYPACETCSCGDGSVIETEDNSNNQLLQGVLVPFSISSAYSELDDITTYNNYVNNSNVITYENRDQLKQLIGGRWTEFSNKTKGTTGLIGEYISSDLPFGERINQFNAKSSYYSGKNIIKVTYEPDSNYDPINDTYTYHYDNTLVMICLPGVEFSNGDLFTVVNPKTSPDKNIAGQPSFNDIGTYSTTGTTIIPDSISVVYGNSTNRQDNLIVNYNTPKLATDNSSKKIYYTYPSDVEYFQIIDTYTVSEFRALSATNNIVKNSFADIIEGTTTITKLINCTCYESITIDVTTSGDIKFNLCNGAVITESYSTGTHVVSFDICISSAEIPVNSTVDFDILAYGDCCSNESLSVKPIDSIDQESRVIICQRGVDPYSPKVSTKFSLGRIFGFDNMDEITVTGDYRINNPIRNTENGLGNEIMCSHELLSNNDTSNGFSLFYPSKFFIPGDNYITYNTLSHNLYSKLDYKSATELPYYQIDSNPDTQLNGTKIESGISDIKYIKTNITNSYLSQIEESEKYSESELFAGSSYMYFDKLTVPPVTTCYENVTIFISPSASGGIVEYQSCDGTVNSFSVGPNGGTYSISDCVNISTILSYDDISFGSITYGNSCQNNVDSLYRSYYYSFIYGGNIPILTMNNPSRIVMRSDRLPSSDIISSEMNNTYLLQQNSNFVIYKITEGKLDIVSPLYNGGDYSDDIEPEDNTYENNVLATFSCENMVDLNCYEQKNGTITVKPNCEDSDSVVNGCYVFCKACDSPPGSDIFGPIRDLPKDFKAILRYQKRFSFFYSICQNVLSQTFTNNWVNGTLFAYPFKINTYYNNKNKVQSRAYCKDVILLHPKSNNFYYRSSPWDDVNKKFIGFKSKGSVDNGANDINLKYPTTVLNLGPRSEFLQQLILNGRYAGYVMNTINETSYNDNSEVVNLFVYSRLLSANFLNLFSGNIITSTLTDPLLKLFNRPGRRVSADFAQTIAVNTQYGVVPLDPNFYTTGSGATNSSIYFNLQKNKDPMLGIMFSATTDNIQNRDYISPGRIIRVNLNNSQFLYDYLGNDSQLTPHYLWKLNQGDPVQELANKPFMFGNQYNEWVTNSESIKALNYQKMDRFTSGYPNYNIQVNQYNSTGFLYANDNNNFNQTTYNYAANFNPNDRKILVGAPWYFYFGLNRGKTAINKFYSKYIGGIDIDGE